MRFTLPRLLHDQFRANSEYFSECTPDQLDKIIVSLGTKHTSLCVCDIGCKGVGALIEGELLRTIDDQQQYGYTDSDGNPALFQFGDDNKIKEMLVFGDSFLRNPHGLRMAETYSDSRHTVVNSALRIGDGKDWDSLTRVWSDSPPAYLPSPSPARSLPRETQAKIESEYSGSKQSVEKLLEQPSAEAGAGGGGMAESLPVVSSYRKSLAQRFFGAINWFWKKTKCAVVGDLDQGGGGGGGGGGAGRKSRKLRRGRSFGRMKRRSRRRSKRRSSKKLK
jgi:hypothetical protein